MALIATGILFGGFFWSLLAFIGKAWPIALIVVGVYLLLRAKKEAATK